MKAKIAVATVSGKAYYLIVRELKKRNIPFLSLTPHERIPMEIKVVLTTVEERPLIGHGRVVALKNEMAPEALINQALQAAQGKERYGKITIGIDPGKTFGLAVLADGRVVETANSSSVQETSDKIRQILENFESTSTASISVKIGDGVLEYQTMLLEALDEVLPSNIVLESVREEGTNLHTGETKHRRGLEDIFSAVKIARRNGQTFTRSKTDESYS